ncbi:hypothetical protein D6D06_08642 [Aureobasidium pullulans]|nr:hypothetical protein D6D06_08642 [Aureobasidium pullulans]THX83795.1 hypothetical protein D6D05_03403 [Aureobasidium pullulans]
MSDRAAKRRRMSEPDSSPSPQRIIKIDGSSPTELLAILANTDESVTSEPASDLNVADGINDTIAQSVNVNDIILDESTTPVETAAPALPPPSGFASDYTATLIVASFPSSVKMSSLLPSLSHRELLLKAFLEHVHPVTKIAQRLVVERLFRAPPYYLDVNPLLASMLFSYLLVAVSSIRHFSDFESQYGASWGTLLMKYEEATRTALARADFMRSDNIRILEALVFYLLGVRRRYPPEAIWPLTNIAVRFGQRLDLHKDGSTLNIPPVESETRRRLWWQIILIDTQTGQLCGQDLLMSSLLSDFDTEEPRNIDDDDLVPESLGTPVEREHLGEMTFCQMQYHFANFLRDKHTGRKLFDSDRSLASKLMIVSIYKTECDDRYPKATLDSDPLYLLAFVNACNAQYRLDHIINHESIRKGGEDNEFTKKQRECVWSASQHRIHTYINTYDITDKYMWYVDNYLPLDALIFSLFESTQFPRQSANMHKEWHNIDQLLTGNPDPMMHPRDPFFKEILKLADLAWKQRERELSRQQEVLARHARPMFLQPLQISMADIWSQGDTEDADTLAERVRDSAMTATAAEDNRLRIEYAAGGKNRSQCCAQLALLGRAVVQE